MTKPEDVEAQHAAALESMTTDQYLAMAREILAVQIRNEGKAKRVFVTRRESLDGVFAAEAEARNAGATPKVDFFLPIDNDLPLQAL